ncbi:MAG TPA: hypothetical protein VIK28_03060 [Sedimentisphaerales bacterium]
MNTTKKKQGRPSKRKTTLAVLRAMLTVPGHKGRFLKKPTPHYEVKRVTLPVSTVAKWLNVSEDTVRCIERGKKGYPFTPERAEIISYQTRVSAEWLQGCKPKAKPLDWLDQPFTQAVFDDRQIQLTSKSSLAKQYHVSFLFIKNMCFLARILLLASKRGKLESYAAHLRTVLGKTLSSLTGDPLSLILHGFDGFKKERPARPNLDAFLDAYERHLKKIYPPAI